MIRWTRRDIVRLAAAGALGLAASRARAAFAAAPTDRRLILVILRGGLDGLAAVAPLGDPDYARARGGLALEPDGLDTPHRLDAMFALHPALTGLAGFWAKGELAVLHAVATPYRERSHFDAQNVLENGSGRAHGATGWLNRALPALGVSDPGQALAVAQNVPLVLQGPQEVSSWMPGVLPETQTDYLDRVRAMYAADPLLAGALDRALALRMQAEEAGHAMADDPARMRRTRGFDNLEPLMSTAGAMLGRDTGPRVAVIEAGGWDTHAAQGAASGALARRLAGLDRGVSALAAALGPVWARTVVLVVTEFGRTVAPNGTGGTDHGTGAAAFALGGGVRGGQVVADWPGLSARALHEGRDLRPTADLRALLLGALAGHMRADPDRVARAAFPDAAGLAPLSRLFQG